MIEKIMTIFKTRKRIKSFLKEVAWANAHYDLSSYGMHETDGTIIVSHLGRRDIIICDLTKRQVSKVLKKTDKLSCIGNINSKPLNIVLHPGQTLAINANSCSHLILELERRMGEQEFVEFCNRVASEKGKILKETKVKASSGIAGKSADSIIIDDPIKPNAETIAAMNDAREGRLTAVGRADELLGSLNDEDEK